jgi:hypothetical protein
MAGPIQLPFMECQARQESPHWPPAAVSFLLTSKQALLLDNASCPVPAPHAVAMAGKDCVAIGSDLRFGVQLQTLATDYKKIYKVHDQLFIGLAGLGTDAQTL